MSRGRYSNHGLHARGSGMPLITLLTDFGLRDPFVGEMKGALLASGRELTFVDLTHEIEPGNVREASWVLLKSWDRFPAGTCHLAVVDPGVGGARGGIAAKAGGHLFVGPDNGILAPALREAAPAEVHRIDPGLLRSARRGTTFDGRDVLAPAAARLAGGAAPGDLGPLVSDLVDLAPFDPVREPRGWNGEVIRVDRFGNVVTAVEETFLRRTFGASWSRIRVRAGGRSLEGIRAAYQEVSEGGLLLTIGGSGTLEICRNGGRAAEELGLQGGSRILIGAPGDSGVESEHGQAEGVGNTGADSAREGAQG